MPTKEYYLANREKIIANTKAWRLAHPERHREHARKSNAKARLKRGQKPRKRKRLKGGGVYCLSYDACPNMVKIGRAYNIPRRMRDIYMYAPLGLTLRSVFSPYPDEEPVFHERFKAYRTNGEWFRLEGELAAFVDANPLDLSAFAAKCRPRGRPRKRTLASEGGIQNRSGPTGQQKAA